MNFMFFEVVFCVLVTSILIRPFTRAYTAEQDVYAINAFYTALGSPLLPGWVPTGGDPCSERWQGVQCLDGYITGIVLNGANLGGQLGDALGSFSSIVTIDLSNNNIGGTIPENLPITVQSLFLSANQFTGSLPSSLSKLTLLTAMSVNNNHLTGDLPDAFQSLASLVNFDLSSNNISGDLPPSVGGLSSLTTLHVQNNQLTGTLNVLEELPLKDLNVEDNLFAGPIPEKLLNIQNFRKDGNPFNIITTPNSAPLPAPSIQRTPPSSPSPPSRVPSAGGTPTHANSSDIRSAPPSSSETKKQSMSTMKIVGYVLLAVVLFAVIVIMAIFCLLKYRERESMDYGFLESRIGMTGRSITEPKIKELPVKTDNDVRKVLKDNSETRKNGHVLDITTTGQKNSLKQEKEHARQRNVTAMPLPPLPLPPSLPRVEKKNVVNPILPSGNASSSTENTNNLPPRNLPPTSVTSFSVGALQQYTNSFSEGNFIRYEGCGKSISC